MNLFTDATLWKSLADNFLRIISFFVVFGAAAIIQAREVNTPSKYAVVLSQSELDTRLKVSVEAVIGVRGAKNQVLYASGSQELSTNCIRNDWSARSLLEGKPALRDLVFGRLLNEEGGFRVEIVYVNGIIAVCNVKSMYIDHIDYLDAAVAALLDSYLREAILTVDSTPQGANVYVDSQSCGTTPTKCVVSLKNRNVVLLRERKVVAALQQDFQSDGSELHLNGALNPAKLFVSGVPHNVPCNLSRITFGRGPECSFTGPLPGVYNLYFIEPFVVQQKTKPLKIYFYADVEIKAGHEVHCVMVDGHMECCRYLIETSGKSTQKNKIGCVQYKPR